MTTTERLRALLDAALATAYSDGHRDGVGCGHDLAPRCVHGGAEWVTEQRQYGFEDEPGRLILAALPRLLAVVEAGKAMPDNSPADGYCPWCGNWTTHSETCPTGVLRAALAALEAET